MVWTKDEVDKYVVQVERNCKSAHEVTIDTSLYTVHTRFVQRFFQFFMVYPPNLQRNLKGFAFARLYREAADNESAKRLVYWFCHFLFYKFPTQFDIKLLSKLSFNSHS